jgi:hypothetical protein
MELFDLVAAATIVLLAMLSSYEYGFRLRMCAVYVGIVLALVLTLPTVRGDATIGLILALSPVLGFAAAALRKVVEWCRRRIWWHKKAPVTIKPPEREPIICMVTSVDAREYRPGHFLNEVT